MCVRGNPRVLSVQLWSAMVHYRLSHLDWGSILPKVFSSKRTEEDRQWEVKIRKVVIACLEVSYPFSCLRWHMFNIREHDTHTHTHARTHAHTHTHTRTHTASIHMLSSLSRIEWYMRKFQDCVVNYSAGSDCYRILVVA